MNNENSENPAIIPAAEKGAEAAVPAPAPKKRGRPRKNPLPETPAPAGEVKEEAAPAAAETAAAEKAPKKEAFLCISEINSNISCKLQLR